MKLFIVTFLILIMVQVAYAAGGEGGVPWRHIKIQAINFFLLVGLLVYFLRKPVKEVFKGRLASYLEEFKKAEAEKAAAAAKKADWVARMDKLETTSAESLATAKKESSELKDKMIKEAQEKADNMMIDAEKNVQNQVMKSKAILQKELLADSMSEARNQLQTEVDQPLRKQLNKEFFEKIKVVQ